MINKINFSRLRFLIVFAIILLSGRESLSQNANFKALDSTQCSGTLFTLIAIDGTYPSTSYSWEITDPSNVTTTYSGNDTIFVVLNSVGLYDVRLTVTNGTTATVLNLGFLEVFSKPTVGFTANGSSSAITGCSPFLVNFDGTSSSPGSGSNYSNVNFDFGDGNIINIGNFGTNSLFSHIYTNSSSSNLAFSPKVNILNSNGCFDTLTLPSITVKPSPTLSSPLNPNSICSGSTFNYIPTSTTSGCTFSWSRASNPSIVQAASSGTYPPFSETLTLAAPGTSDAAVTYVVTTTAPAPNSCSTQENVVVTVKALPSVSIVPSTLTICSGSSGTLTASGTPSGGTYAWSGGLGSAATATVSAAGTYSVTYSNNGCAGNPSSASVSLATPPTVSLAVTENSGSSNNDGDICSGDVATITATPSASGGTYSWSPVTSLFTDASCTVPYVAGTSASIVYAKPLSTITYSVTYTLNCPSSPASSVINVLSGPTNNYSASVSNACSAPVTTNFTSTSTAPAGSTVTNTAWTFPGGTSSVGSGVGPISVIYSTGNQSYGITLTTTASNGCSTSSSYANAITIGNGSAPTSTYSVSPSNSICVGTSLNFSYTGAGADSIRWDLGNGTVIWRADNVSLAYVYTTPGTYTVSMTPYTVVGNQLGCSGSVSTQVISVLGPKAVFTTSPLNCSNQFTRTFTNTSTGTTGSATYAWSFPSGTPSTANTVGPHTVTWITEGTYTVTLTVSDPSTGCPSSSITSTVRVNSSTGADFQAYDNTTPTRVVTTDICLGSTLYFYNETPAPQYVTQSADNIRTQWDFNTNNGVVSMPAVVPNELKGPIESNIFSASANITGNLYAPGQYGIGMINRDNNGCPDTVIKPNYITVHGIIPNLSIPDTLCAGQAFTPTDNSTAPMSSIASRTWSWGDGSANTTGNNATPSHTYANPGTYTITLTITDNSGLVPACSTVITKQVLVQKPTASFTVNRNYICNNQSVVVTNNSTGVGLTNWNWSATNATPATGTGSSFGTFTFTSQGNQNITLSVTDNYGCIDDTIIPISVFDVVAFATPSTTNFSCFAGTNGNPNVVTFTNLSTNNVDNTSAQWNFGNGQTSTVWQPSVTYNLPGTYNVSLTVSSLTGCQNTTNVGTITVGGPSATIDVVNASLTGCSCYNVSINTSTSGTTSAILYYGTSGEAGLSIPSNSQTNSNSYCNTSNSPQTFTPYVFISNGSCFGSIFSSETITVNPVPATPVITVGAPTCSANGSATITNYVGTQTYTFNPAGPTVGVGGVITGLTTGTNYTISTSNGLCQSPASSSFSIGAQLVTPSTPTITTTAASCSANGAATVSNYIGTQTYSFNPIGPSVGAGGIISPLTPGTSYTVTTNNGSCTSASSIAFSIAAQLITPAIPTISTSAATCSANGTATITNYGATLSYTFSPVGPTVGAGGIISNLTPVTNYTVTAGNGSCTSGQSSSFNIATQLVTPATPTISTTAATCLASGTATISNYIGTQTYTFNPIGPSVGAGGIISALSPGTSYTITTNNGSCTSASSIAFSIAAQLTTPSAPNISTTAATCSTAGTATVSNYVASQSYTFNPVGPTVGAGGIITGIIAGTNYTVTTGNGSCTSTSTSFSTSPVLGAPSTPTTSITAATCSSNGTATITNYIGTYTYSFNPVGPSVAAGGIINSLTPGTNYTVTTNNGTCSSAASASFSIAAQLSTPSVPTITTAAASCSANGSATISNYLAPQAYIFTPTGPTVGAGGVISGMTPNTNYSVTAGNGSCTSASSALFSISSQSTVPATPTTTTTNATCSSNGTATISNYNGAQTYSFNPVGPSVAAGGIINSLTPGTNYTVTTNNGTCSSAASASFSIAAQLSTPSVPTITTAAASCSANGSATISNYLASQTYTFTPAGPSVGAGGLISGLTFGTTYSVNASNGSCTSNPSNNFSVSAQFAATSITGANNLCVGLTTNLTGSGTPSAVNPWSSLNSTLATVSSTGIVTGVSSGNVTIQYTDNNGCSTQTTLLINPANTLDIGNDITVCSTTNSISLSASISGLATTVSWSGGSNNFSPMQGLNTNYTFGVTPSPYYLYAETVDPANTCPPAKDSLLVTINPVPVVNAGLDQVLCSNDTLSLNGTLGGSATSGTWTSNGNGAEEFLPSNSTLNGLFVPNQTGFIQITLTSNDPDGNGPCIAVSDVINVTIDNAPTANAGADFVSCSNVPVQLNGIIGGGASSLTWTGNGTFNNASLANAQYTPTATELAAGTAILTLSTDDPAGPCTLVTDQVVVTFTLPATANAGADQTICQGSNATLSGSFGGAATSAIWTTSGSGTFTPNANSLTATYTPSNADITNGSVILTLTTNDPAGPCGPINDQMILTINPAPTANNLPVTAICSGQTLNVQLPNTPTFSYTWIATDNSNTAGESLALQTTTLINDQITNNSAVDQQVVYQITPTNTVTGCLGQAFNYSITVRPVATATQVSNQTICVPNSTTAVIFTGSPSGTTFSWTNSQPSIGLTTPGSGSIPSFSPTNTGNAIDTATITVTPNYQGCPGTPMSFDYYVIPTLTVNQIANDTLCGGDVYAGAVFTGNAPGVTYIWQNNNTSISSPIVVPGLGAGDIASFTTSNTGSLVQDATITVTPTLAGCPNGTPMIFHIVVKPLPNVFVNPTSQNVCHNNASQLVDFSGNLDGLATYNWSHDNISIGLGSPGFNDIPPFTVTNTGNIPQTANFNVNATYDGCTGPNTTFTITADPVPIITAIPDQQLCGNTGTNAITFTSVNNVAGSVFNWTNSASSIGQPAIGSGDIPSFIVPDSIQNTLIAQFEVTPSYNGCNGTTDIFQIVVLPVPLVYPLTNQGDCSGSTTNQVTILGSHDPVATYEWNNDNVSIGISGPVTSNTIPSFTLVGFPNQTTISTFTVTPSLVTNGQTCMGIPQQFTITAVDPIPNIYPTLDTTLCSGETFHQHIFGGTISNPNVTYNWQNNETASGLASNGTNSIPTQILTNNSLSDIVSQIIITPTDGVCSGDADTFNITVKPRPDLFLSQTFDSLCAGNSTDLINFSSSLTGTTYSWIGTTNVGYTPNNGTGSSIASVIGVNSGNTPLTDSIFVSSFNNGCAGDIDTLTIIVNPTAIVSTSFPNYEFCSGETINIPFNGSVVGATYSWTNNNTNTGIGFTGNGGALSLTVSNTSLVNQTSTITVTPTFNGCPGQTYSFTVMVKPLPNIFPAIADIALCANTNTPVIDFLGDYDDSTNFDWINSNISIGANGSLPTAGTGDILPFLTENTSGVTQVDSVIVTPELNGCIGSKDTFLITVYPITQVVTSDISVCSGTTIPTTCFTGTTPGVIYNWSSNNIGIGMDGSGVDCIPSFTGITGTTVQIATITISPVFNGCPGLNGTMQIEVRPVPIINPNPDLTFCDNQFADSVLFSSNINSTYLWTNNNISIGLGANGDGNLDSYISSNEFLVEQIDLTAEIVVTPTAFGCSGVNDTFNITVHPLPIVNAGLDTFLCLNQCLTLNATGTAITYSWDNGGLQGQQYCPTGSVMLHVIGTDQNFCQNTDSVHIEYSTDLPPVVNAGPDDAICFGEPYTLTATGDADIYLWNNNVNDGQSFTPSQTNTYFVIGTDLSNGCVASDTMELVVNPLPDVTISTPDSILCAGETAILTANGALTYQWTNGPATQVYTFIPTQTDDYEVVGYDINGCTDTAEITVVVNPLPIPLFSSDMTFGGCLPFCPTLTDQTGVNGNGPASASVLWEFSNNTISTEMGTTNPCFDDYGCYDVTLISTSAEGCKDTLVQENYLCVNQIIASFTPDVAEQLISDPCFEFTNNSVNATSFQWFFGDGEESDFVSTNHCFDSIGCYPVTLVAYAQDGCTDSVVQIVCIKDQLIIYVPNAFTPDGDGLNEVFLPILTSGYKPGTYELNIFNRWGERIFNTTDETTGWDGTYLGNQVQIGTYTYTIRLKDSMSNKIYTFDGRVSLIR